MIVIGIGGLVLGHFSYTTHRKVVDMGPVSASVSQHHSVPIPEIAGIGAIAAGVLLAFAGQRKA